MYAAKYLQIPSIGLWTFAGPGSMVGIVDMFLMQTGLEAPEILRQVETFEPMLESIKRFKENYGFLTEIQWKISWRFCHSYPFIFHVFGAWVLLAWQVLTWTSVPSWNPRVSYRHCVKRVSTS